MGLIQKIKALWKVNSAVNELRKEAKKMEGTKPGYKTTEFWGKVAVQVFSLVGVLKGFVAPELAAVIISTMEGVYGIARTIAKYKGKELPEIPKA